MRDLLIKEATEDRPVQDYRTPLFPEASHLMGKMVQAGAIAACWSGAGPTLLGICDLTVADRVRDGAERAMEDLKVEGRAITLRPDLQGLEVDSPPGSAAEHTPTWLVSST